MIILSMNPRAEIIKTVFILVLFPHSIWNRKDIEINVYNINRFALTPTVRLLIPNPV